MGTGARRSGQEDLRAGYEKEYGRNEVRMKTFTTHALMVLIMLPCAALADGNCRVIEYQDHYDVECVGDHSPSALLQTTVPEANIQARAAYQQVQQLYDDSNKEVKVVSTSRSFGVYRPRSNPY
jgi:hypothetical protein